MLSTMFTYLITYFGLYGNTPPPRNHWSMGFIVGSALCLRIKFAYFSEEWQWFIWTKTLRTHIYISISIYFTGVALIAKFCANIPFSGAVSVYAFWPHRQVTDHTQNDWTSIQQVTAHWWLPRHSTLDQFANSVWSQLWLRTPPQHKSSQWWAESGWWNKSASCHYFGLYGDTPPPPPPPLQSLIYAHYSR